MITYYKLSMPIKHFINKYDIKYNVHCFLFDKQRKTKILTVCHSLFCPQMLTYLLYMWFFNV